MKLRITPRAGGDLERINSYIGARNPAASRRVIEAIYSALQVIAAHPQAGRAQELGIRRFTIPRYPYLIFYRVDELAKVVEVLTVTHAAREQERV